MAKTVKRYYGDVDFKGNQLLDVGGIALPVGSWTPGIAFGGNAVGVTANAVSGTYVKIGRLVFISGYFYASSKGTSAGNLSITGLPFVVDGTHTAFSLRFNRVAFDGAISAFALDGATSIGIEGMPSTGTLVPLTNAHVVNDSAFIVSGCYVTN